MKIINNNWQRQIVLEDNLIHTIVFENKKYYRENILELIRQHKGYEGNFISVSYTHLPSPRDTR